MYLVKSVVPSLPGTKQGSTASGYSTNTATAMVLKSSNEIFMFKMPQKCLKILITKIIKFTHAGHAFRPTFAMN